MKSAAINKKSAFSFSAPNPQCTNDHFPCALYWISGNAAVHRLLIIRNTSTELYQNPGG